MRVRLGARSKALMRSTTRRFGYDLVPFLSGIARCQRATLLQSAVAIDVGANVGQFAGRIRHLGFKGRIISFEPGSAAFKDLAQFAQRQEGNWEVRQVALGAHLGAAVLNVSANSVSSSLLVPQRAHLSADPRVATAYSETVKVSTLDSELDGTAGPFWIKLDVQGFEEAVLAGGHETLKNALAVQTELSFDQLYDQQADWLAVCKLLCEAGFRLRYLEPGFQDPKSGYLQQADALFVRNPSFTA
jgi:FkbM family methyltransferase